MKKTSLILLIITICLLLPTSCEKYPPRLPAEVEDAFEPDFIVGSGSGSILGSLAANIFKGIAQGAGAEIGGEIMGRAMGALGICSDSESGINITPLVTQLNQINNSLLTIHDDLSNITSQLNELNNNLSQLRCDQALAEMPGFIGRIQFLETKYKAILYNASNLGVVDTDDIKAWVDDVLAEGESNYVENLIESLYKLHNNLVEERDGGNSALKICLQAMDQPIRYSWDDTQYYNYVHSIRDYYYYYQCMSLLFISEAYYYKAFQVISPDLRVDLNAIDVSKIKDDPLANSKLTTLHLAIKKIYENLRVQFKMFGAPLSNDLVTIQNIGEDSSTLWVRSLEEFTLAYGDDCPDILTSAAPHGVTAGAYDDPLPEDILYSGYSGWRSASLDDLIKLTHEFDHENEMLYQHMEARGLHNANEKIIISSTTSNAKVMPYEDNKLELYKLGLMSLPEDREFLTFIDGSLPREQPIYRDEDYYRLIKFPTYGQAVGDDFNFPMTNNFTPPDYGLAFHTIIGNYVAKVATDDPSYYALFYAPGWMNDWEFFGIPMANFAARQYRWPVLRLSDLPYSIAERTNAGGVPSKWGAYFEEYLETVLPKPPDEVMNLE